MKLKNFLDKESISIQQMANDLELPYEYIRRYVNENKIPRPETMAKIVAYTKGEVTANDFYGIEESQFE
jgi:DNA-binding helix-turn-helix protein